MIDRIDTEKCTGCGTCQKTCALDVFRIEPDQASLSPCMAACPAGVDIRGYNWLMQMGRVDEAAAKLRERNPFPALTGRVCPRFCETECGRAKVDAAVNINALEQYLGDITLSDAPEQPSVLHVAKIAVAGSGPAGLSCAWFMAVRGYPVTVFEALPEPGGMLRYGIPAYRLPEAVVEAQVAQLKALGVRFACNTRIGAGGDLSLADLEKRGFKAVCLAPGATRSRRAHIPGEALPGVLHGVEFLRRIRSGGQNDLNAPGGQPGRVVVVGGGDVAMDVALSAQRLGARSVEIVCLESEAAMPAFPHNVEDARAAGIALHSGWGPVEVRGTERAQGLVARRCLSVLDENGRFAPTFADAERREFPADTVIFAIGQACDTAPFKSVAQLDAHGRITVDPVTFGASTWNVFAAGDAVSGPSSVIKAIAGGREAALSMHRLLSGGHQHSGRAEQRKLAERLPGEGIPPMPRQERERLPAKGFAENRLGLDHIQASDEAQRCMTCGAKARIAYRDDCMTCFFCEMRCPSEAIEVHPFKERLPYCMEYNFGGY